MLRRLLLRRLAEAQPVGDEKLTADDEENDDAAENVGKRLVEPERGRDLARAAVEEHKRQKKRSLHERIREGREKLLLKAFIQRRKCSLIFMRLMRRERLIKTLF